MLHALDTNMHCSLRMCPGFRARNRNGSLPQVSGLATAASVVGQTLSSDCMHDCMHDPRGLNNPLGIVNGHDWLEALSRSVWHRCAV